MSLLLDIVGVVAGLLLWAGGLLLFLYCAFGNAEIGKYGRAKAWSGMAFLYLLATVFLMDELR